MQRSVTRCRPFGLLTFDGERLDVVHQAMLALGVQLSGVCLPNGSTRPLGACASLTFHARESPGETWSELDGQSCLPVAAVRPTYQRQAAKVERSEKNTVLGGLAPHRRMCDNLHMATNLAIDDQLLEEARRIGGQKTKRATVTEALSEYIQRRKQQQIVELFGKLDVDPRYNYKKQRRRK